jgi:ketosteroid isomerase-like protein
MQAQEQRQKSDIERIYHEWDDALSKGDVERLLNLYADDIVFESPLICHVMGKEKGICRGKQEVATLLDLVRQRKPKVRQFYRTGYMTDGKKLMWEYPSTTPSGQQMDFVEVMEVEGGLIHKHRVYWGWYGFNVLKNDQYHH